MMMMMMMIVDLYSALRRAPLLRYVSRCIVKRNVFSPDRKDPMLSDGSRRWSGSMFQTIGTATENARRPNLLSTILFCGFLIHSGWMLWFVFMSKCACLLMIHNSVAVWYRVVWCTMMISQSFPLMYLQLNRSTNKVIIHLFLCEI